MLTAAILIGAALAIALPFILLKNKISENKIVFLCKALAVALFALGFLRGFLNDNFIWVINGGTYGEVYYESSDIGQSILRWFLFIGYMVFPCAVFFSLRTFKNVAVYFCTPVALIAAFFYDDFMGYFLTNSGRGIWASPFIRHAHLSLELVLAIVLGLLLRFRLKHKFNVKSLAEWKYFACLLPVIVLCTFPVYLPQSLFGFTKLLMKPFSIQHILWLVLIFAIIIVMYFLLRFKPFEVRYAVCVYMALYLFVHYNWIYLMDLKLSRLPFQLCNLGSYLILIGLLIRKQGFSNFILLANVPGALIALFVPDVEEGMLSFWNIHYYIEHMLVFIVPLLMVTLRIMERPDKKAVKHFFIGFSIYFAFCSIVGSLFNGYLYKPLDFFFNEVNYFYLFDDTVLSVLWFLNFTRKLPLQINGYTLYPLYMACVYILFSVFCMGFFYVYKYLCKIGDDHFHLRQIRIDLYREKHPQSKRVFRENYQD